MASEPRTPNTSSLSSSFITPCTFWFSLECSSVLFTSLLSSLSFGSSCSQSWLWCATLTFGSLTLASLLPSKPYSWKKTDLATFTLRKKSWMPKQVSIYLSIHLLPFVRVCTNKKLLSYKIYFERQYSYLYVGTCFWSLFLTRTENFGANFGFVSDRWKIMKGRFETD